MSYTGNYTEHAKWANGWHPTHDTTWDWIVLKGQKARPFVAPTGWPNRSSPEISADEEHRRALAAEAAKRSRVRRSLAELGELIPTEYRKLRG